MDDPATQPDDALVARVRGGERECFAELVRRYERALHRVARSRLGRDDWAEDVVQETFLAAFRSLATYDPARVFRTWLWTILLNECHRHYQRRAGRAPLAVLDERNEEPASFPTERATHSPLDALLSQERTALLESLLARLSPVQADALRLRFFAGLKFQEIAVAMSCSLNTAKCRVRWGLTRMAQLMETERTLKPDEGRATEEDLP